MDMVCVTDPITDDRWYTLSLYLHAQKLLIQLWMVAAHKAVPLKYSWCW